MVQYSAREIVMMYVIGKQCLPIKLGTIHLLSKRQSLN